MIPRSPSRFALLLAATAAPVALAVADGKAVPAPAATAPPALARAHAEVWSPLDPPYAAAARAARGGNFDEAAAALAPLVESGKGAAARARVVLGLHAWQAERCAEAREALGRGPGPGEFEDWRLFALADCAARSGAAAGAGAVPEAAAAYQALAARTPPSPLAELALLRLAELAWAENDAARSLAWIERGRGHELAPAERAQLETLAWTIGRALGDPAVEIDAARRLLVDAPLEASRLEVAIPLAARGQDWRELLTVEELLRRADALLDIGISEGALRTLEAVPVAARGPAWQALQARALVADERGAEALGLLAGASGGSRDESAELELLRARAADEAATVRRGRPHPAAEERVRLQDVARASLVRAAETAESPELRKRALAALFAELEAEDRFEEAIVVLRRLAALDPAGTFGARALWDRGWREYRSGNYSGAIGYWSELGSLYPSLSYARSAAYWTARGHEALGEKDRARGLYRDLVAVDTPDFYARQASLRLAGPRGAASPAALEAEADREPWPSDPRLARARLLSDLGLDRAALTEIEHLAPFAEARAASALKALALSRRGVPRESLRELRKAFPRLGTAHQRTVPREALELFYPRAFDERVALFARAQGLPASLVFGIVHQESGFDPTAKSRSGARGLMQIMPATGKELARRLKMSYSAERLYEPDYSLRLGTAYFRQLLGQFDGEVELALASYNGGPGRIGRLWRAHGPDRGLDLFLEDLYLEEPRDYVKRIVVLAESYRSLYSDLG